MLKNILFAMIFFIGISCFAKTFDFVVKDENNYAIDGASVTVNGVEKLTDIFGKASFEIDGDFTEVEVKKAEYYNLRFSLNEKKRRESEMEIVLKKNALSLVSFNFNMDQGSMRYKELGGEEVKELQFSDSFLKMNLPEGRYEFIFSSENYIDRKEIVAIKSGFTTFNIELEKKSDKFFVVTDTSKSPGALFLDDFPEGGSAIKNCKLVFLRAGLPVKEINFKKNFEFTDLNYGVYDLKMTAPGYKPLQLDGLVISENSKKVILLNMEPLKVFVNGSTHFKESLIGGVDVIFTGEDGSSYSFKSDLSGNFIGTIRPGKYRVNVEKPGYVLKATDDSAYDFSKHDEIYSLQLELDEIPSVVRGVVLDRNGSPISEAKVLIRVEDTETGFQTDKNGSFSGEVGYGVAFVKIEKSGYRPFGTIKRIQRFSTVNNLVFSLNPYLSSISGFLTNGVNPLKNVKLLLYESDDKFIASSVSGKNGYYEFPDLNILKEYHIKIDDSNYLEYSSEQLLLGKENVENFNLILTSSNLKFILELTKPGGDMVSNELVVVNGQKFITDINGIIIDEIKNFSKKENIRVEIPKYNLRKIFKFSPEDKRPFKIKMTLE